jgi:hypothetical protein
MCILFQKKLWLLVLINCLFLIFYGFQIEHVNKNTSFEYFRIKRDIFSLILSDVTGIN